MKNFTISLLFLGFLFSCSNGEKKSLSLSDPDLQKIIEYQDTKNVKELIKYFVSPNMQLRERACLAFGSIQDTSALTSLYTMLEEDEAIARAAAFAVGQTANASSLPVLKRILERSMNEATRFEFFVAIGKCGGLDENYYLVSNYNVGKDARGTAWALFYLARNRFLNEAGLELTLKILEKESDIDTRLGAAHTLSRNTLENPWEKILGLIKEEQNEDVRMALIKGLKGIPSEALTKELISQMKTYSDNSQINFLSSVNGVSSALLSIYASGIISSNANINLQIEAANYLSTFPNDVKDLLSDIDMDRLNWRVRASLIRSVLNENNDELNDYAFALYESSTNLYERGELLSILAFGEKQKSWLQEQILKNDSIVCTYGMNSFAAMMDSEDSITKNSDVPFLMQCLSASNSSVISYSSYLLRDSVLLPSISIDSLNKHLNSLELPKNQEAYVTLKETIDFLSGNSEMKTDLPLNNPIALESLPKLEKIKGFLVRTTKGDITMKIETMDAPGTLLSISNLVENGYFNGKLFHRVVPNFVIQTGCPQGDGWGSLDITMRSEFTPLTYSTGAVGMASSGKDTESSQWFITHSPTPHLNGRYTIFAYVTEGMEVVQNMEVGDRIIDMTIIYN